VRVAIVGHQKGRTTKENINRNFGMPRPEGYRKAQRLFKLAERQTIQDRRVRVVRVSSLRSLQDCHVLYVGSPAMLAEVGAPSAAEFLHEVVEKPVLTVSDSPTFLAQGGILNVFVGEEGKLRVEISPRQAAKAGLVLSSRLLALARIVDVPAPMTTP
jgi:hypothetical protein